MEVKNETQLNISLSVIWNIKEMLVTETKY